MVAPNGEDWKIHLSSESRTRVINKIVNTLARHLPLSSSEGRIELLKTATRFESKIFNQAQSQSDYLRRISLKMLTMESSRHDGSSGSSFNSPPYDEF